MNDVHDTLNAAEVRESRPSATRRQLLKAAAASAPVIATFQSGAAFATASAAQCVADAIHSPPPEPVITESHDHLVRVAASEARFKTNANCSDDNGGVLVYAIPRTDDPTTGDAWKYATWYYAETGELVPEAEIPENENKICHFDQVAVLQYFQADSDLTGVYTNPEEWYYPRVQQQSGDFIAVSGTCLCSVDPMYKDTLGC